MSNAESVLLQKKNQLKVRPLYQCLALSAQGSIDFEPNAQSLLGSKEFQQEAERVFIVSNIKSVDHCILSIDQDRTVCETIEKIALDFGSDYELSFANGGDQNNNTIPERPICDQMRIILVDGLGDKIQSSSWLLKK